MSRAIEPIRVHHVDASELPNAFPPIGGSGNGAAAISAKLSAVPWPPPGERELDELAEMLLIEVA